MSRSKKTNGPSRAPSEHEMLMDNPREDFNEIRKKLNKLNKAEN